MSGAFSKGAFNAALLQAAFSLLHGIANSPICFTKALRKCFRSFKAYRWCWIIFVYSRLMSATQKHNQIYLISANVGTGIGGVWVNIV